jgi:hypothetical protein
MARGSLLAISLLLGGLGAACSNARITSVELAKGRDGDRPVEPTTTFAGTDRVHLFVGADGVADGAKITVDWIADDAAGGRVFKINTAEAAVESPRRAVFTFYNPERPLPPGRYRAVVRLDGRTRNVPFEIR